MKLQIALDLFTLKFYEQFFHQLQKNMVWDGWKLEKQHKNSEKSCVVGSAFDAAFSTTAILITMKDE